MSKRQRKKPDLRIRIPYYPHDFVEMPPETRQLILQANRSPNDIKFIDDDDDDIKTTSQNTDPGVTSPIGSVKFEDQFRASTPEVKFYEPEDIKSKSDLEVNDGPQYRRQLKRTSISAPDGLEKKDLAALQKIYDENVSFR